MANTPKQEILKRLQLWRALCGNCSKDAYWHGYSDAIVHAKAIVQEELED